MKKEWKQIEIDGSEYIPFNWRDIEYGRAEFTVCIHYKRGKFVECWVYPTQTRLDTYWHYTGSMFHGLSISSYEGLEEPKTWLVQWCKEHKSVSISVYAPADAKYVRICDSGIEFWITDFSKKKRG